MNAAWVRRRHHCGVPMGGDFGDVWRCDCGRCWLFLMPNGVIRWWPRPEHATESDDDGGNEG